MKTMLLLTLLVTSMLAAVVACGKQDPKAELNRLTGTPLALGNTMHATAEAKASCNMVSQLGTCNEYRGGPSFGLEKSLCESYRGTFASQGCPTAGQTALCTMSAGEVKRYYGSGVAGDHALSTAEAKADCASDAARGVFQIQ